MVHEKKQAGLGKKVCLTRGTSGLGNSSWVVHAQLPNLPTEPVPASRRRVAEHGSALALGRVPGVGSRAQAPILLMAKRLQRALEDRAQVVDRLALGPWSAMGSHQLAVAGEALTNCSVVP